jgi:excisionase family DNA binding protein
MTGMSVDKSGWLSLTEASKLLGVHYTTLRRWADAGSIPCFRTPGGHRRFRAADLNAWLEGKGTTALVPQADALVHSAVGFARQEMAQQQIAGESWYLAFEPEEERLQMREAGRNLFGLAIKYVSRGGGHGAVLQDGRRTGDFYGRQCAERGVSLVDTVRAFFFFRQSLLRVTAPGQSGSGRYDAEDARIHQQLGYFLDEVLFACLASYEETCRSLLANESA